MNSQETFDTVIRHLVKQGSQSIILSYSSLCAYRGSDGKSCAIGCLIPNELYDPHMENKSYRLLVEKFPQVAELLERECRPELLVRLQELHDIHSNFDGKKNQVTPSFFAMATDIAEAFRLDITVLDELEKQYAIASDST